MKTEEFDKLFDDGHDISHLLDWDNAWRAGEEPWAKKDAVPMGTLTIQAPTWMMMQIDREAERIGITPESLVNVWLDKIVRHTAIPMQTAH